MEYYVAKSYETWPRLCEPYEVKGKMYVKVRTPRGAEKTVRAYTKPQNTITNTKNGAVEIIQPAKSRKDVLGFGDAGYIWIFKGTTSNSTYENLEWFRASPCRYTRLWGWYLPSSEEMPNPLPVDIQPVKLTWDEVSFNGDLLGDKDIVKVVDSKLYDAGVSKWIGKVGERLNLTLKCIRATESDGYFGVSRFYVFNDAAGNVFTWSTSAKVLEEGHIYELAGSVKAHDTYRAVEQTALTRCSIKNDLGETDFEET